MPDTTAIPTPAIHGPYEDLFIEGLRVLETVIKDAPPEVKQQFWSQWLTFHTGLQAFAAKIDVLHLFHAKE